MRGLGRYSPMCKSLNRLLEHRNFPKLMDLIRFIFKTAAKGIMGTEIS